ncbi:MAG: DUF1818 family protein [Cyanobacteria bacterium J06649_4]
MIRQVLSGEGWRIGWNPAAGQFCGLIAGQTWAIELTQQEFHDFCRSAQQLHRTMTSMAEQLMEEERLCCEQETETVWLEAEGFPYQYSLRFILLTGRRCEGEWPHSVVAELLQAVERLTPS